MDTPLPPTAPSDYSGLKEELQKIAGIIEQYPDHLKQRAFELLIAAYLNSNEAKNGTAAIASDPPATENAPAEEDSAEAADNSVPLATEEESIAPNGESAEAVAGEASGNEPAEEFSIPAEEPIVSELEPDSQIKANLDNTTNMLRRRIRLRTMSQMPWRTSN